MVISLDENSLQQTLLCSEHKFVVLFISTIKRFHWCYHFITLYSIIIASLQYECRMPAGEHYENMQAAYNADKTQILIEYCENVLGYKWSDDKRLVPGCINYEHGVPCKCCALKNSGN